MTMIIRLSFLVAALLVLAGCGGDGGDGGDGEDLGQPKLETPEFNLTGVWKTTESDCQSYSDDLSDLELAQLDSGAPAEGEKHLGSEIVQYGNDLDITDIETGQKIEGTFSGTRFISSLPSSS